MMFDLGLTYFDLDKHDLSLPKSALENMERIREYARKSLASNTWRAYESDIQGFRAWGGTIPATPELVASYLADHAECLAVSSLTRKLAAINKMHEMANHLSPTKSEIVRMTMRGIRREHSTKQRQASPLLRDDLIALINALSAYKKDIRDKALLMIGFSAALRRSELVALNMNDLEFTDAGLIITIRKSKTDQEGHGRKISIPNGRTRYCPVQTLKDWLTHLPHNEGPLFTNIRKGDNITADRLSSGAVSTIIKEHVQKIGLDPANYSGHSLRAGFVSTAAQMNVPEWKIMKQSGHKSHQTLLRYIRDAKLFEDHALDSIF